MSFAFATIKTVEMKHLIERRQMEERKFTPIELVRLTGLTQREIADALGVSKATVARRVEKKKKNWTVLEIEKLSQMTRIPLAQIDV